MNEDQILNISIEARITKLERDLQRGVSVVGRNVNSMEQRAKLASTRIEKYFSGIGAGMLAGITSAVSVRAAQQLIDASTRIGNSLKVAGLAGQDLEKVYKSLFAAAQRNAAPLESLAQLYSRVSLVQGELGASTDDMLKFTDNVALALRVAGTDAQSASGALLQLSQAMGSGTVHAEEFNAVLEGALPIAQAVATGLTEAGGSVSKLRALVVDGKVSSQAFFDAFQAGASTLQERVAGSETTISSSFVRLQNVLIDAAGRFNDTSSAGQRFANFLDTLGAKITEIANSPAFDKAINDLGDAMSQTFANDARDIERIIGIVNRMQAAFDAFGSSAGDANAQLDEAYQNMGNLAQNTRGRFGEVDAAFQDLVQQLIDGRGTAESAADAITALGEANPDFSALADKIGATIQNFIKLRDAANAAHAAAGGADYPTGPAPTWEDLQAFQPPKAAPVKHVSLADYPITPTTGGGGGGGRSASSMREERDAAKDLIEELQAELRTIGMSEVEKRIDTELRRAGANATDAQKASIRDLVTQIDSQNAAMDRVQNAMDGAKGAAKDFLGGLLGDLMRGTDAATALSNAFANLASKLLDLALNSIIDNLLGNMLGGLGGGIVGGALGLSEGGEVHAATGGLIRGPGTSTSDSIPARLSAGEFVVNAAATRRNLDLLHAINDGQITAFAAGGLAGDSPAIRANNDNIKVANDNAAPVINISAPVTVNANGGDPAQNADLAKRIGKQMEITMRGVVSAEIAKQMRPGNAMNTRSR